MKIQILIAIVVLITTTNALLPTPQQIFDGNPPPPISKKELGFIVNSYLLKIQTAAFFASADTSPGSTTFEEFKQTAPVFLSFLLPLEQPLSLETLKLLFLEFDLNGDKIIDPAEDAFLQYVVFQVIYDNYDTLVTGPRDARIKRVKKIIASYKDLLDQIDACGGNLPPFVLKFFSLDKNSKICLSQFEAGMKALGKYLGLDYSYNPTLLFDYFNIYDKNSDNRLTKQELTPFVVLNLRAHLGVLKALVPA